ncbi:hypothetical protein [Ktedonobacter sp. SOSP1-52]|uniref:hypothetical protein n=1 Tax=Ktedonobacter sp. SOSP1-52 TaxID=2778366 RepID=UPI0019155DC9|nr:hypothetical protein [Ktedonobacter sp. SOSP1-52]
MFDFRPADQVCATVLQMFRDFCNRSNADSGPPNFHDDRAEWLYETSFMQIYGFQQTEPSPQTSSIAMIDGFFAHLTTDTDLHGEIRSYFLSEAKRNQYARPGALPLWREVEMSEARNAVATFLTGHVLLEPWDRERTRPYIIRKDVLHLAEAFIDLFEPGGKYYISQTPLKKGVWSSLPVTHADLHACIISVQRKHQRMGLVLAQDWSG